MNKDLLDDELQIEDSNGYYLELLKKSLPVTKFAAVMLMVCSFLDVIETFSYELAYGNFLFKNISLILILIIIKNIFIFIVGRKLWQKSKALEGLNKQSFESNEATWLSHTAQIWHWLGGVAFISILMLIRRLF